MKQWLKDLWFEIKPQNNEEKKLRTIGVLSTMIAILVARGNIILNRFGQEIWIVAVASACLICTYNRNK